MRRICIIFEQISAAARRAATLTPLPVSAGQAAIFVGSDDIVPNGDKR
jgi:hypothetical protein